MCASMRSLQPSSPFSSMHASLALRDSWHELHALQGFLPFVSSSALVSGSVAGNPCAPMSSPIRGLGRAADEEDDPILFIVRFSHATNPENWINQGYTFYCAKKDYNYSGQDVDNTR